MSDFCTCSEWKNLKDNNYNIFMKDPDYGWVLHWIELTEENGYTQVNRFGVEIKFCPMCGKRLK